MGHTIRLALASDAAAISVVSKHLGYAELSDSETKEKLSQLILSITDEVYVVESIGRIVAWLHVFHARRLASEDFYEIGGLVVDPNYRKQGIGGALVQFAQSTHNGKIRVRCNETRLDTHKFYEASGFENTKVQRVFEKRT